MNHIRNRSGQLMGWTEVNSNGFTYVYAATGGLRGWYDPNCDKTFQVGGGIFGYGNQLTSLLC